MSASGPQQPFPGQAAPAAAAQNGAPSGRASGCPPHVLEAIYGKQANKKEALERSLHRWWTEYADRKNDEEDEHVADSLLVGGGRGAHAVGRCVAIAIRLTLPLHLCSPAV